MPIDDHPFDALQRQFENEGRAVSPISNLLSNIAADSPCHGRLIALQEF